MSQIGSYPCPRCGTSSPAGQQFCSNCGITLSNVGNLPTERPNTPLDPYPQTPPPPPPPYNAYPQQGYQPPWQSTQPPPAYAKPQKDSSKSVVRQIGCGVVLVVLLIVVLLGTAGYFLVRSLGSAATSSVQPSSTNAITSNPTTTSNSTTPATQGSTSTTPINTTVTYANVNITIVNAQQATTFVDDPDQNGVVRLNLDEHVNPIDEAVQTSNTYYYSDTFELLLPGGKSAAPLHAQHITGPDPSSKAQTNWVDFPVPTTTNVNQLVLRLGTIAEVQEDIPLTGHADLSKYAPKKVSPNTQVHYGSMLWTLTTATAQLSAGYKQATKGMHFIVVALTIDNPSSSDVSSYPLDYIRLKSGSTMIAPVGNTTIPTTLAANTTNSKGTVAFLAPEGDTAFTLVLLTNGLTGATTDATINFQIK